MSLWFSGCGILVIYTNVMPNLFQIVLAPVFRQILVSIISRHNIRKQANFSQIKVVCSVLPLRTINSKFFNAGVC